jgi:hypothetical protein
MRKRREGRKGRSKKAPVKEDGVSTRWMLQWIRTKPVSFAVLFHAPVRNDRNGANDPGQTG